MTLFEAAKSVPALDVAERYANVKAVRKGRRAWACCPFHKDDEPSLSFDLDGKFAGRFKCWSCNRLGASVDFVAQWFNEPATIAAKRICADYGIEFENADADVLKKAKAKKAADHLTAEISEALAFASCVASGIIKESEANLAKINDGDINATSDRACLLAIIEDAKAFEEAIHTPKDAETARALLTAKIGDEWTKDKLERLYRYLKKIDDETGTNYVSWYKRGTL